MHVFKTFLVKCHISLFFLHNLKMFASICVLTQALYNKLKHTKLIGILLPTKEMLVHLFLAFRWRYLTFLRCVFIQAN